MKKFIDKYYYFLVVFLFACSLTITIVTKLPVKVNVHNYPLQKLYYADGVPMDSIEYNNTIRRYNNLRILDTLYCDCYE